jgi:hypothetical protein
MTSHIVQEQRREEEERQREEKKSKTKALSTATGAVAGIAIPAALKKEDVCVKFDVDCATASSS